jgi:hypothetical protein
MMAHKKIRMPQIRMIKRIFVSKVGNFILPTFVLELPLGAGGVRERISKKDIVPSSIFII